MSGGLQKEIGSAALVFSYSLRMLPSCRGYRKVSVACRYIGWSGMMGSFWFTAPSPRLLGQPIIGRPAHQPGYSISLKRFREVPPFGQLPRQSPEHHDGRGSCLALLGCDGIAGGSVPGAQSFDFPAQAIGIKEWCEEARTMSIFPSDLAPVGDAKSKEN